MSTTSSSRAQLARLMQLIMSIRGGDFPSAADLAEANEVSRRTVYRDVETLQAAGVPISYDAERRGYRLGASFVFNPPPLSQDEAVALWIAAQRGADENGLDREARSAALKVVNALPTGVRQHVQALGARLRMPLSRKTASPDRGQLLRSLFRALVENRQVRVWYRVAVGPSPQVTKMSPYRLECGRLGWVLVGRSSAHRGVRSLPIERIDMVESTNDPFELPPRFEGSEQVELDPDAMMGVLRLRFAPRVAEQAAEEARDRGGVALIGPDGAAEATVPAEPATLLGWVLGHGEEVEVLEPEEMRRLVAQVARRLIRRYDPETFLGGYAGLGG